MHQMAGFPLSFPTKSKQQAAGGRLYLLDENYHVFVTVYSLLFYSRIEVFLIRLKWVCFKIKLI